MQSPLHHIAGCILHNDLFKVIVIIPEFRHLHQQFIRQAGTIDRAEAIPGGQNFAASGTAWKRIAAGDTEFGVVAVFKVTNGTFHGRNLLFSLF
jgi:hypothetical protein